MIDSFFWFFKREKGHPSSFVYPRRGLTNLKMKEKIMYPPVVDPSSSSTYLALGDDTHVKDHHPSIMERGESFHSCVSSISEISTVDSLCDAEQLVHSHYSSSPSLNQSHSCYLRDEHKIILGESDASSMGGLTNSKMKEKIIHPPVVDPSSSSTYLALGDDTHVKDHPLSISSGTLAPPKMEREESFHSCVSSISSEESPSSEWPFPRPREYYERRDRSPCMEIEECCSYNGVSRTNSSSSSLTASDSDSLKKSVRELRAITFDLLKCLSKSSSSGMNQQEALDWLIQVQTALHLVTKYSSSWRSGLSRRSDSDSAELRRSILELRSRGSLILNGLQTASPQESADVTKTEAVARKLKLKRMLYTFMDSHSQFYNKADAEMGTLFLSEHTTTWNKIMRMSCVEALVLGRIYDVIFSHVFYARELMLIYAKLTESHIPAVPWRPRPLCGRVRRISSLKDKVILQTSEGREFVVEKSVASEMKRIVDKISNDASSNVIPLPDVTGRILAKVIEYCQIHVGCESRAAQDATVREELDAWDMEFADVDHEILFELFTAAMYLQTQGLFDLLRSRVAGVQLANYLTPRSSFLHLLQQCTSWKQRLSLVSNHFLRPSTSMILFPRRF